MSRCSLVLLGALVSLTFACNAPTAPTPTPGPVVSPAPAVSPDPVVPTPEAPPAPMPVPDPPAPRGDTFEAEVGFAHWYGPAVFPGHFEVTITPVRVEAGARGFDILASTNGSVLAGTRNVETLSIEVRPDGTGSWIYSGLAGQASGGLVRR